MVGRRIDWSVDMVSIADFEALVPLDHGLCTVAIGRGDRTPQVTVVNAGVVEHPRDRGADPAARAGDERCSALETHFITPLIAG